MFLAAKKESDKIVASSFYEETKNGGGRRNIRTAPTFSDNASAASSITGGVTSEGSVRFREDDGDIVDTALAFG